jgi:hypothetical protein
MNFYTWFVVMLLFILTQGLNVFGVMSDEDLNQGYLWTICMVLLFSVKTEK